MMALFCLAVWFILFAVLGKNKLVCGETCHTGYHAYDWCANGCCNGYIYEYCCSNNYLDYSDGSSYASAYGSWLSNHKWAIALIVVGSVAGFITLVSTLVCCIKSCTAKNSKTGPAGVNPGQRATGPFVVSHPTQQYQYPLQQQHLHQQHLPQQHLKQQHLQQQPPFYVPGTYGVGYAGPSGGYVPPAPAPAPVSSDEHSDSDNSSNGVIGVVTGNL